MFLRHLDWILNVGVGNRAWLYKEAPNSISQLQPLGGLSLRRKISLFIIAAFITALTVLNHGCSPSNEADINDESINFDLNDPKIKDRLGEDDGYAFAIMYGADIHGSLETCG
jgi:hypothetical protein